MHVVVKSLPYNIEMHNEQNKQKSETMRRPDGA